MAEKNKLKQNAPYSYPYEFGAFLILPLNYYYNE